MSVVLENTTFHQTAWQPSVWLNLST